MKILIYIIIAIGVGLMIFNVTKLDLENPLAGDSSVAVISILAAACAVLLMVILLLSLKMKAKKKQ